MGISRVFVIKAHMTEARNSEQRSRIMFREYMRAGEAAKSCVLWPTLRIMLRIIPQDIGSTARPLAADLEDESAHAADDSILGGSVCARRHHEFVSSPMFFACQRSIVCYTHSPILRCAHGLFPGMRQQGWTMDMMMLSTCGGTP